MKKRSKIASLVLFLAALVVGFNAQPGWCSFNKLVAGYRQCDFAFFAGGVAVLPDHTLLAAADDGLYLLASLSAVGDDCTTTMTKLNSNHYQTLIIGLDGLVYSFKRVALPYVYDLVAITICGGNDKVVISHNNVTLDPLGMTLDPISGDLFMTHLQNNKNNVDRIVHLYDGGTPTVEPMWGSFSSTVPVEFDGLAWSCDGTTLLAASSKDYKDNRIIKFTRSGGAGSLFVTLADKSGPDGLAFGAAGTNLEGYVFSNNNDGTVDKIPLINNGTQFQTIAKGVERGDWIFVDNQGDLLLIESNHLTRLSNIFGGAWVSPGSSLCSDLGCGAKAATTPQIGQEGACLSGLDANLVLSLSQSACGSCESCTTLNQARTTLGALLNSLDPPLGYLDTLKVTLGTLYRSCPCNPDPFTPCYFPSFCGRPEGCDITKTKFPLGLDLESYDPVLQSFMRKASSP